MRGEWRIDPIPIALPSMGARQNATCGESCPTISGVDDEGKIATEEFDIVDEMVVDEFADVIVVLNVAVVKLAARVVEVVVEVQVTTGVGHDPI